MPPALQLTPRNLRLLCLGALIGAAVVAVFGLLWAAHPDPAYWIALAEQGRTYLSARPWALVLVLAVLPGLGVPLSPLLIFFGLVLTPRYGLVPTCALGIAALAVCSTWTYLLAAGPLQRFLRTRLLTKYPLPELRGASALRVGLIVRITPGVPYPLQNVGLGVIGLDLKTYLLASIPVQSLYTVGFIVTGGALFEGRIGLALTGVVLLAVIILSARLWLNRRKRNDG